ncbi:MAG TPA: hypothetical protein H9830_13950, partial [Candidatus Agrococcus pullicola]|nr:hypothetical protein [Candidatus Agrococcus pullicola]
MKQGLNHPPGLSWPRKIATLLASGALLASGLVATSAALTVTPAAAEGSAESGNSHATTTYYAYLDEGDVLDTSFLVSTRNGGSDSVGDDRHYTITDPDGVVQWECTVDGTAPYGTGCTSPTLTGPAGAWKIQDDQVPADSLVRMAWNIDVSTAEGTPVPGRVWSERPQISQDAGELRDLSFWMVNDTGYQYRVDLNDYNGYQSFITASAFGITDENCVPTYKSVEASTEPGRDGLPDDLSLRTDCAPIFRAFFAEPAADLPATAPSADGVLNVVPPVLGSEDLAVTDLAFSSNAANSADGVFTHSINERFSGAYELQIDTNGNGSYTDDVDRIISLSADGSGEYSYEFDGLDGLGVAVEDCSLMNARLYFPKVGEIHVTQLDVEGRAGGIQVTAINGENAGDDTVYWDDTDLDLDSRENSTPQLDGTDG